MSTAKLLHSPVQTPPVFGKRAANDEVHNPNATSYAIFPITQEDIEELRCNLCDDDTTELLASLGSYDAVDERFSKVPLSNSYSAIDGDGELIACYGVTNTTDVVLNGTTYKVGSAWFLSTNRLLEHRLSAARIARSTIAQIMHGNDIIGNDVYKGNLVTRAWLKYMGFEEVFDKPDTGFFGEGFMTFAKFSSESVRNDYGDYIEKIRGNCS